MSYDCSGHEGTSRQLPILPSSLSSVVPPEQILANGNDYPLLREALGTKELEEVELIKNAILRVPIMHGAPAYSIRRNTFRQYNGIMPNIFTNAITKGNTYELDRSLGLDRAVFGVWPCFDIPSFVRDHLQREGLGIVAVDSGLLLHPNTIVGGDDINMALGQDHNLNDEMHAPYSQLSDVSQENLQSNYFSRLLTGETWVELTARKIFRSLKTGRSLPYYGEVKIFTDAVSSSRIVATDYYSSTCMQYNDYLSGLHEDSSPDLKAVWARILEKVPDNSKY